MPATHRHLDGTRTRSTTATCVPPSSWPALALAQVRFLPTGDPPHREAPLAPAALRLEMVRAAVAGEPAFAVDDREIRRTGLSYTVDTLTELRAELPGRSLCLLIGMDAFLGMPGWHRWREIFELAHVVVAHRPGWKAPITGPLGEVMVDRGTGSASRTLRLRPHPDQSSPSSRSPRPSCGS
jgi:nicotinate-nucleotide adenylyltransferase